MSFHLTENTNENVFPLLYYSLLQCIKDIPNKDYKNTIVNVITDVKIQYFHLDLKKGRIGPGLGHRDSYMTGFGAYHLSIA